MTISLQMKNRAARRNVKKMEVFVPWVRYYGWNYQKLIIYLTLLHLKLQIQAAASNIPTCRAIIDSMGHFRPQHFGPLSSVDFGSQTFEGGGCTHQANNNWYQVMRQNDTAPSCDAAPPVGSKWQRVCACTPYFLAQKEQSCQAACEANGYSCNLEKVIKMEPCRYLI